MVAADPGPAASGVGSPLVLELRREVQAGWVLTPLSPSQFEAGPYGCILLTLSAILSRTTEL